MIKILISEDDNRKFETIEKVITSNIEEVEIKREIACKETIEELSKNKYDFLIQDMQLPMEDHYNSNSRFDGGAYVFLELEKLNIDIKKVICSSSNSAIKTMEFFNLKDEKFLLYDVMFTDWKQELIDLIKGI